MKALKDLGVKFADLKDTCKSLNGTGFLEDKLPVVGVKGPELLTAFLTAINGLSDEQAEAMPKDVAKFYESLPEEVFAEGENTGNSEAEAGADAGTDEQAAGSSEEAVVSDCPTFGGQNPKEPECKDCKKNTPDEFKACKKETKAKAEKAQAKQDKKPKGDGKKTRYGHNPGSMGGDLDDMLWEGATMKKMVNHLVKNHGRDEAKAENKVIGHIRWLGNKKGITVELVDEKKQQYKAKQEFMKGRTADNTAPSKSGK